MTGGNTNHYTTADLLLRPGRITESLIISWLRPNPKRPYTNGAPALKGFAENKPKPREDERGTSAPNRTRETERTGAQTTEKRHPTKLEHTSACTANRAHRAHTKHRKHRGRHKTQRDKSTQHSTKATQHNTSQDKAARHSTAQGSTTQHDTRSTTKSTSTWQQRSSAAAAFLKHRLYAGRAWMQTPRPGIEPGSSA